VHPDTKWPKVKLCKEQMCVYHSRIHESQCSAKLVDEMRRVNCPYYPMTDEFIVAEIKKEIQKRLKKTRIKTQITIDPVSVGRFVRSRCCLNGVSIGTAIDQILTQTKTTSALWVHSREGHLLGSEGVAKKKYKIPPFSGGGGFCFNGEEHKS